MVENKRPLRKEPGRMEFQGLTGVAARSLKGRRRGGAPGSPGRDGVPTLTARSKRAAGRHRGDQRHADRNINRVVADNQEAVKNSLLISRPSPRRWNAIREIDSVMLKVDGCDGQADNLMLSPEHAGRRQGGRRAVPGGEIDPRNWREDFGQAIGS